MNLSDENISSFQELYKLEFGDTLSESNARHQAMSLIRLVKNTYIPMTREEMIATKREIELETLDEMKHEYNRPQREDDLPSFPRHKK